MGKAATASAAFFFYLTFVLTAVWAHPLSAAETPAEKKLTGLYRFKGPQFTDEECRALTLRFQDELFKLHTMEVMEQDKMDAVVQEHVMAEAGYYTDSGMAEIGKKVGVAQFLVPSISRIGSITTINVQLLDVASGHTIRSASLDTKHHVDKILTTDLPVLARRIGGSGKPGENVVQFDPNLKRKPVAVLDISGYGINNNETKGLTNRLRVELFNTGQYDVMEREQMNKLLKEQGLMQSGICQDENCMVKAGEVIGVRYMLGGAVSQISSMFSVSSRLIDVESGKIVRSATADVNGNLEKVLKNTMNDMARAISGLPVYQRVSYPAIIWGGASVLVAGGGVFYTLKGFSGFRDYKAEQYDLNRLRSLKNNSKQNFFVSYGFYGAAAITAGLSVSVAIRDHIKLRIDQEASDPGTTAIPVSRIGLSLEFKR